MDRKVVVVERGVEFRPSSLVSALESGFNSGVVEVDTNEVGLSIDDVLRIQREAGENGYEARYRRHPELKGIYHICLERRPENV